MAVNAKFLADFTDFFTAVEKAETKLREFSLEPSKVERALSRMTDSFSGRQLIADATLAAEAVDRIGGTSKLTEDELRKVATQAQAAAEKLRLMGQDVPDKIANLAKAIDPLPEKLTLAQKAGDALRSSFAQLTASFTLANLLNSTITALGNFARDAIASGSAIADLASKTGVSTDAIQRMQFVAQQTGTTVETFTKAVFQLGVRLSSGDQSVRKGAEDLGLAFDKIRKAKPEEQFDQVARALEKMTNPQERNRIALALFGKTAEEVIPAISQGYGKISDEAFRMSDAQVQALDRASDAWDKFVRNTKTSIAATAADLVLAAEQFEKLSLGEKITTAIRFLSPEKARETVSSLAAIATESEHVATVVEGSGVPALKSYAQEMADAEREANRLTAAQREQIKIGLELGKSTQELGDRYGVSAQAIKLLTDQMKLQNELMGGDLVAKAENLLDVLSRMEKQGIRPSQTAFEDIVKSMTTAQDVMASTGRAGEEMYQRLEAARRKFSGLTAEGLIPSTHLGIPTAQAPGIDTSPSELGNLLQDIEQAIDKEFEWNAAIDDTQAGLVDVTQAHHDATAAAVDAATRGVSSYKQITAAILEASAALRVAVPLGFSWVEAYKAAGFFVDINSGAVRGGSPSKPGGGGMGGSPVIVNNISVPHGMSAAGAQQMADAVGKAVLQRIGRA